MHRLYRLQLRLNLTRREGAALLALGALLTLGLAARAWQQHPPTLPDDAYAEVDRLFAEADHIPDTPAPASLASAPASLAPAPVVPARIERLDLNTASAEELEQLPRIGPALAARILAYRARHGGFRRVEELTAVPGIGDKTLARLHPYLTVSSAASPD
ncbi:hypothetical protein AWN76_017250 [Rhodothermaceae bacterium RA]|nr:hypothetical protein AWN76_017250 [Rhodothermaceae bacterium RA]